MDRGAWWAILHGVAKSRTRLSDCTTKLKSFHVSKDAINKMKRQPKDWEKIFADVVISKGFVSKICKQLMMLNHIKTKNPIKNSPGQNIGVGSLSLLQGIFPIHGSNPGLPHCRQILNQLSHKGSPRIVEWIAFPLL